jgi:predicted transcriptional regulator
VSKIQSKIQSKAPLSPLTMRIFECLAAYGKPMSVLRMAKELDILPPTAYKAIAPLEEARLVQTVKLLSGPKYYRCYPLMQAEWRYTQKARADFETWFAPALRKKLAFAKLKSTFQFLCVY